MPQTTTGQQYDKRHAKTTIAISVLAANRFIGIDGGYATSAGGVHDSEGISETGGAIGDAVPVVTSYTYLVEANEAINPGDYLKPAADGSGRAAVGTATVHCARAVGSATALGQLVEARIVTHRNA